MSSRILVVGATSAIAQCAARRWAAEGAKLFLAGRNEGRLEILAGDLRVRGAALVEYRAMDAGSTTGHEDLIVQAIDRLGGLDIALIAHGVLGKQKECEKSYSAAAEVFQVNLLSVISILTPVANYMENARRGSIAVISSVAGDRGRQSNYYYGASKGGLSIFLQGLRNRLARSAVQVTTIKPGFVDTPMTAHLAKNALFANPDAVAARMIAAIQKGREEVYIPGFWRFIMLAVQLIPERIFKRMAM